MSSAQKAICQWSFFREFQYLPLHHFQIPICPVFTSCIQCFFLDKTMQKYSGTPQLHYPLSRYFRSYAFLNWFKKIQPKLSKKNVIIFFFLLFYCQMLWSFPHKFNSAGVCSMKCYNFFSTALESLSRPERLKNIHEFCLKRKWIHFFPANVGAQRWFVLHRPIVLHAL